MQGKIKQLKTLKEKKETLDQLLHLVHKNNEKIDHLLFNKEDSGMKGSEQPEMIEYEDKVQRLFRLV